MALKRPSSINAKRFTASCTTIKNIQDFFMVSCSISNPFRTCHQIFCSYIIHTLWTLIACLMFNRPWIRITLLIIKAPNKWRYMALLITKYICPCIIHMLAVAFSNPWIDLLLTRFAYGILINRWIILQYEPHKHNTPTGISIYVMVTVVLRKCI